MVSGGFARNVRWLAFGGALGLAAACADSEGDAGSGGRNGGSAGSPSSGGTQAGFAGAQNGGAGGATAGTGAGGATGTAGRGGGGGAGAAAGSGAGAGTSGASGSAAAGAGGANGTAGEGGAGRGAAGAAGEAGGRSEAGAGGEGGGSGSRLYCPYDWMRVQTLGRSTDGSIDFELQRCMATVCGGGCQVYSVYFRITHDGRTDEAVDEQIEYTQTHHNWSDSLTATLPDRTLRWSVGLTEPFGMEDTVAIDALDGSPILEDVVVPSETEGFFDWM